MDRSGIINLKGELRDYHRFFLERNPFPSLAIPEDVPAITADREAAIKRFQDSIIELTKNSTTTITVIVGPYGSGKSHLFRIFKQSVNTQLVSNDNGALAIYIRSPGQDFSDLYFATIDDMGKSFLTECASHMLTHQIKTNRKESENYFNSEAISQFMGGQMSFESLLTLPGSRHLDMARDLRKSLLSDVKDDDLVFAFLSLPHPEFGSKAWKWMLGGSLDRKEKNQLNVEKTIDNSDYAFALFSDLRKILKLVGLKSLVLLIDELEKITFLSKTPRVEYQDVLRHWIDLSPSDTCFYFAIAPHQWDLLVKEPTALVRRLSGNWYVLKKFEKPELRELLEKYLYAGRMDPFEAKEAKKRFPDCDPALSPFTDEALESMLEKTGGTISNLLLLARKCLEYLYDESENFKSVTPQLVEHVSEQEGFE
jgi:hypothetical protein